MSSVLASILKTVPSRERLICGHFEVFERLGDGGADDVGIAGEVLKGPSSAVAAGRCVGVFNASARRSRSRSEPEQHARPAASATARAVTRVSCPFSTHLEESIRR